MSYSEDISFKIMIKHPLIKHLIFTNISFIDQLMSAIPYIINNIYFETFL